MIYLLLNRGQGNIYVLDQNIFHRLILHAFLRLEFHFKMMYSSEKVFRSFVYFTSQIVPSGVTVIDGQEYGIRLDDPVGQSPSIAVTVGDMTNAALELGSYAT